MDSKRYLNFKNQEYSFVGSIGFKGLILGNYITTIYHIKGDKYKEYYCCNGKNLFVVKRGFYIYKKGK